MKIGGDCVGYGTVLQALAHLGVPIVHGHLSELDPVKRSLVTAVCARAGCPVPTGHLLSDISQRPSEKLDFYEAACRCPPFSRAGIQQGSDDNRASVLFQGIRWIQENRPKVFRLKEVPTLKVEFPLLGKKMGTQLFMFLVYFFRVGSFDNEICFHPPIFTIECLTWFVHNFLFERSIGCFQHVKALVCHRFGSTFTT